MTLFTILDKLDATLKEIGGCTDGNCCISPPKGMHTNGGCRCAQSRPYDPRAEKALRNYQIAVKDIRAMAESMSADMLELIAETERRGL